MLKLAIEHLKALSQQRRETSADQIGYINTAVQALIDNAKLVHADSMREAQEKHEAMLSDLEELRTALMQNIDAATRHNTSAISQIIDDDM